MNSMKTIGISEFKTHCIGVIREAHRTREPLIVTRRGQPLVRVEPIIGNSEERRLGELADSIRIKVDLLDEDFDEDWELEG